MLLATLPALLGTELIWGLRMGSSATNMPPIQGGYVTDSVTGVAVDSAGYVYITGNIQQFPPENSLGPRMAAFVAKVSPDGARVVYWKVIEGASSRAIAVDREGNAVIAGLVSTGIDAAPVSIPRPASGEQAAFVAKLNSSGSAFQFAAYLGGNGMTQARAIALDAQANVYFTGATAATDFPVTTSAFQKTNRSTTSNCAYGLTEGFAGKLSADGKTLLYSTYLGGSKCDAGNGIVVDASGSAVVAGATSSLDFPVSPGAPQGKPFGSDSWSGAFAAKLSPDGDRLVYSTYLGEYSLGAAGVALDASSNAYVAFPSSANSEGMYSAAAGAFVMKLNAAGTSKQYTASIGPVVPSAIAVDAAGNAYTTGSTQGGLPVVGAVQPSFFGGTCVLYSSSGSLPQGSTVCSDAYAMEIDPSGAKVLFSTYLTGSQKDGGAAIAVDTKSNVYVGGFGELTVANSNPASNGGSAFLVKMGGARTPPFFTTASITNAVDFRPGLPAPGGAATIFCANLTGISGIRQSSGSPLPFELAGVQVKIGNAPAPLYSVSEIAGLQQINFQVPFEVASNNIEVSQNGVTAYVSLAPQATPPVLFSVGENGVIQHGDYTSVTPESPAERGEIVVAYGTGFGAVEPEIPSGTAPLDATLRSVTTRVSATIGGYTAEVLFAGLTYGYVGLYQVNLRVPDGVDSGAQDLAISLPPVQTGYDYRFYRAIYTRRDGKPVKIWIR